VWVKIVTRRGEHLRYCETVCCCLAGRDEGVVGRGESGVVADVIRVVVLREQ